MSTRASATRVLEGTLQYISPEQTGRTNRSVDYRTDLYSFGVLLYEASCCFFLFVFPFPLAVCFWSCFRLC